MPFYIGIFIYIIIELFFINLFVQEFGAWMFFFEIILSGVIGIFILLRSRINILEDLSKLFSQKISPMGFLGSNLMRTLGAIFLILPGILCDVIGIILECFAFLISSTSFFKSKQSHSEHFENSFEHDKESEIIDVEIISEDKNPKQEK